jgi:hypothetical protein
MAIEQSHLFELMESYARRHRCFVAELFVNDQGTGYFVCFRSDTPSRESPSRFDCVYATIDLDRARDAIAMCELDKDFTGQTDARLSRLGGLEHGGKGQSAR